MSSKEADDASTSWRDIRVDKTQRASQLLEDALIGHSFRLLKTEVKFTQVDEVKGSAALLISHKRGEVSFDMKFSFKCKFEILFEGKTYKGFLGFEKLDMQILARGEYPIRVSWLDNKPPANKFVYNQTTATLTSSAAKQSINECMRKFEAACIDEVAKALMAKQQETSSSSSQAKEEESDEGSIASLSTLPGALVKLRKKKKDEEKPDKDEGLLVVKEPTRDSSVKGFLMHGLHALQSEIGFGEHTHGVEQTEAAETRADSQALGAEEGGEIDEEHHHHKHKHHHHHHLDENGQEIDEETRLRKHYLHVKHQQELEEKHAHAKHHTVGHIHHDKRHPNHRGGKSDHHLEGDHELGEDGEEAAELNVAAKLAKSHSHFGGGTFHHVNIEEERASHKHHHKHHEPLDRAHSQHLEGGAAISSKEMAILEGTEFIDHKKERHEHIHGKNTLASQKKKSQMGML